MSQKADDQDRIDVEIEREYGPFAEVAQVNGVTYDGQHVWFAAGEKLHGFSPLTGEAKSSLSVACDAGTAFDGTHLHQLAGDRIQKVDPHTGRVLSSIPAPRTGRNSGLAWAEGSLWVGQYDERQIVRIDPGTGEILSTVSSNRFVTGVSFCDGELWHATSSESNSCDTDGGALRSELRKIDSRTGEVLERLALPAGLQVSGLESDGKGRFFCGGGKSRTVRVVKRPKCG
jgi:hypothetical protein